MDATLPCLAPIPFRLQGVDAIHIAGCLVQEVPCPYFENDAVAREIEEKASVPVVVGIE